MSYPSAIHLNPTPLFTECRLIPIDQETKNAFDQQDTPHADLCADIIGIIGEEHFRVRAFPYERDGHFLVTLLAVGKEVCEQATFTQEQIESLIAQHFSIIQQKVYAAYVAHHEA